MRPRPTVAAGAGIVLSTLLAAGPLLALQAAQDWENKEISDLVIEGLRNENRTTLENVSGLKKGVPLTKDRLDKAYKALWGMGKFEEGLTITPTPDPADPARRIIVRIALREYPLVEEVQFEQLLEIPLSQIRNNLRLARGDPLNPFFLKQDREFIRDQYLQKGYPFSGVEESLRPGPAGGVILTWKVTEGPLVSVTSLEFTGNLSVPESDLRRFMLTKENSRLLGLILTESQPFVERHLREDIERIKLYYYLEGWLDIRVGERVFVRDLEYSDDKTAVTIRIHVDEGRRYAVRSVRFEFDAASRRIFPEAEMRSWLESRPGEPYTENNASKDLAKIREKYGERAYIQAEVSFNHVADPERRELDLVFTVKENEKVHVGKLTFEGNTKTRDDVLRREFVRTGFVPGEEYNKRSLDRALQRLKDRGFVEPQGGVVQRTQEGDEPGTRDVILDIKEGQTGTVRFAAGYSSSFGILGILELSQRNFDLADVPSSFGDLVGGTAFSGGGQFFRVRLAPAAQRQSYSLDFREPYVFGYEFGLGLRGYAVNTRRESYRDERLGGSITVDKRVEPFAFQLSFKAERIRIDDIDDHAPLIIRDLGGENTVFSLTPAIIYDTRDSIVFPTEGFRSLVSLEYAGQVLAGDFDYNKLTFEAEGHVTLFETDSRLRHVGSFAFTFGWVHGARRDEDVPLFEHFYAGGRDSIRGFDFRGMGPHEQGDPVGGEGYALLTLEYSYPLFVEFLRGAFFWDVANLTREVELLAHDKWRNTVGFGIRFLIPQLGNIPVKLDFGWPLTREDEDERQTVTFDIGTLF